MIRYNWNDLKKYTNNNIDKMKLYLAKVYVEQGSMYEFLLANKWAINIYNSKEIKSSYLTNVVDFIANPDKGTNEEQYVYLHLSSLRDVFAYNNTKGRAIFLPIWKAESYYNLNRLKNNRLLIIDDKNIFFIYEGDN